MAQFFRKSFWIVFFVPLLSACGSASGDSSDNCSGAVCDSQFSESPGVTPFSGLQTGDSFGWGKFIRESYQTKDVDSLPIPVYFAFFSDEEKKALQEGIDIANTAVGFQVFEVVDSWDRLDRVIYKVDAVFFDDPEADGTDFHNVIGYTYNRNIYMDGKYDAGRVVTDWAIEVRADHVNKWVVAHELGHTMGIQKHAMIDYQDDITIPLEPNSLMGPVIGANPSMDDYNEMMQMQGKLLKEYMGIK